MSEYRRVQRAHPKILQSEIINQKPVLVAEFPERDSATLLQQVRNPLSGPRDPIQDAHSTVGIFRKAISDLLQFVGIFRSQYRGANSRKHNTGSFLSRKQQ